jgi:DNA polymerase/3'-5' exonuclease PolX
MKLALAEELAGKLIERLGPACERIEVAGSVRRKRPEPHDLEFVLISKFEERPVDMFKSRSAPAVERVLDEMIAAGTMRWDELVRRNGPHYKRLQHVGTGAVIELYFARVENFGLQWALRTGPGDFNHTLVTRISYGGAMALDMAMKDGFLWRRGVRLETPSEERFFAEIGVPHWWPEMRSNERLLAFLRKRRAGQVDAAELARFHLLI